MTDVDAKWREAEGPWPRPPLRKRIDREPQLPCAVCGAPMQKVMLEAIALDRCDSHGIWFDFGELDRLESTAQLERRPIGHRPVESLPVERPMAGPQNPRLTIASRYRVVELLEEELRREPESFEIRVALAGVLVSMFELVEPTEANELARRTVELIAPLEPTGTLNAAQLAMLGRSRALLGG